MSEKYHFYKLVASDGKNIWESLGANQDINVAQADATKGLRKIEESVGKIKLEDIEISEKKFES